MATIEPDNTEQVAELESEFVRLLQLTLFRVLGAEYRLADSYRSQLAAASPGERLLALHDHPLDVASMLSGIPLTDGHTSRYQRLLAEKDGHSDQPTIRPVVRVMPHSELLSDYSIPLYALESLLTKFGYESFADRREVWTLNRELRQRTFTLPMPGIIFIPRSIFIRGEKFLDREDVKKLIDLIGARIDDEGERSQFLLSVQETMGLWLRDLHS